MDSQNSETAIRLLGSMKTHDNATGNATCAEPAEIVLRFGPLCYRIVGHDDWGVEIISQLREHLGDASGSAAAELTLHAVRHPISLQPETARGLPLALELKTCRRTGGLPPTLRPVLGSPAPSSGWRVTGDDMGGYVWRHPGHEEAIWAYLAPPRSTRPLFPLPWCCLLEDIVGIAGGLVHAALVVHEGAGFLLTAEPGGGKTTAAGRVPPDWDVLADDAALVWPDGAGGFYASPLPTWGFMTRGNPLPLALEKWSLDRQVKVAGVALLRKAKQLSLFPVRPAYAAKELHTRFSEHPGVCSLRILFREHVFRVACSLARSVPVWRLELEVDSAFWECLRIEAMIHAR